MTHVKPAWQLDADMKLRSRLTEARLAASMTQAEVAAAMSWPQSRVSKIETGEFQAPRFVDVVRLARLYNVPLSWFAEVV